MCIRDRINGNGEIVSMRDGMAAVVAAEAVLESSTSGNSVLIGER